MHRVLLYDGDCGFCTASARVLGRLGCALELVPWQRWPHLAEHGINERAAAETLHVIDGTRVYVGHEAIAHALETCAPAWRPLGRALRSRWLAPLARPSYAWVAAHRHQLPGGTPACALDPKETP